MTSESLVSSEAVTVDEEEEDTTRDFLPPDLAEYLKQAEDAMLAATDITSPAYVAPARHNNGSNSIISNNNNNNNNMQAIRESYESEDVPNSTSRTPPVFPSTLEEEDSVLRKILGDPTNTTANNANTTPIGNSKNDHASKEMNHYQRQDRNLEAEFGAEEQTQPLQDSTLNLTDMMILNGNDSVVVPEDEEGVAIDEILTGESTIVESEIRKNGSHEYSDIAHATISPIQRLAKSNNNRNYESKDQNGENMKKLNISSNSSSVLLSPEEKKARATAVSARKKRMDEQLDKIKKRRESIGQSNQYTNTSASKASSAVTADSSSKMSRARLLQSVGKISATATTPSAYHHEEDYVPTSARAVSRISASSRLLQGTHAAENPTVTTGTTSSGENRRLSVSRISSSSRLLQPTHSPSVISNNKSSTRDIGEGPVPRRVSSSVSSRLLRPTKASTEHRESARRESISKISGNSTPGTPTLTVPEAPKFSTSSRLGEKSFKSTNLRRDSLDPNPISRAFGSPTHAIVLPPRPPTACSTPRQLTIPKTPNFSTTKRHGKHRYSIGGGASVCSGMSDGELSPPLAEKVNKFDKSMMRSGKINPIPAKSEMKLTIPKPPKFVSRYSRDEISKSSSPTFAEVMASYSKSVRKSDNISTYEPTLTVPKSPNFSHITHRPRPKSSAELEEEMMENLKKKPFKARPVTSLIARPVSANSTSYLSRGLTKPEPFRLSTSRRQSSVNDLPPAPTKDDIELAKRFRARPMPNLQANPTLQSSTKPKLTVPKAPRLSISNRKVEKSDTKENLIARMKERVKQVS